MRCQRSWKITPQRVACFKFSIEGWRQQGHIGRAFNPTIVHGQTPTHSSTPRAPLGVELRELPLTPARDGCRASWLSLHESNKCVVAAHVIAAIPASAH
jgi:hypothetical protein